MMIFSVMRKQTEENFVKRIFFRVLALIAALLLTVQIGAPCILAISDAAPNNITNKSDVLDASYNFKFGLTDNGVTVNKDGSWSVEMYLDGANDLFEYDAWYGIYDLGVEPAADGDSKGAWGYVMSKTDSATECALEADGQLPSKRFTFRFDSKTDLTEAAEGCSNPVVSGTYNLYLFYSHHGEDQYKIARSTVITIGEPVDLIADYEHVIVIGIDGAGTFFKDAATPNIDRIFEDSPAAVSYKAKTEYPSRSAENWTSEHRLPEYVEIVKSSNELLRSAMYGFTDLYHAPNTKKLFDATAFGGLDARAMADLTAGDSLWSKDQKSDEAWEIQSKEAKSIADKWLVGDKPYEKMIGEMKALVEANKNGIVSRKEMLDKLAAAEWLLVNNEKMMIEDPEDPINPIPNWGNRYWKALTETREALGIDKHTSMRDMIQADYAASAKAVNTPTYNEAQIKDYALDPEAREVYDSMELQKEQFATQSAHVTLTEAQNEKKTDEIVMTTDRVQISIKALDQRIIMKNEPKSYNFVIERAAEVNLSKPAADWKANER